MGRARRATATGALLGAGLVVALVLAEALAALLPHPDCPSRAAPLWHPDTATGWALTPGARARVTVCHGKKLLRSHEVVINPQGQRDVPRPPGARTRPRVLVLGDSFVEAVQVPLARTFTQLLERTGGMEVLNAGVSGYSTDNELRAWARLGPRYRPHVVLLVFFVGNDVQENGARLYLLDPHGLPPKPWLLADEASGPLRACVAAHRAAATVGAWVPDALWQRSRATRFLLAGGIQGALAAVCERPAGGRLVAGAPEMLGVYGTPHTVAWEEAWRMTERRLRRLASDVRATGARFRVVLAPAGAELYPQMRLLERWHPTLRAREWDYDYPYARLESLLDSERVDWIDLRPAFRAHFATSGETGYFTWDSHWDETGHAIVAAQLRPVLDDALGPP